MTTTVQNLMESAGYKTAPTTEHKVIEAMDLVRRGADGDMLAKAMLREAISTDDFRHLLNTSTQDQVSVEMEQVTDETTLLARSVTVPNFEEVTWRDLFLNAGPMRRVLEGQEYQTRDPFADTLIRFRIFKFGEFYKYTWEMALADRWNWLLQLPSLIAQDSTETRNENVIGQLTDADGNLSSSFFPEIENLALSYETVKAALRRLRNRRFQLDPSQKRRRADLSNALLVVPGGGIADEARAIVNAGNVREITNPNGRNRIEREVANEVNSLTVVESDTFFSNLDPEIADTSWAIIPNGNSRNPALLSGSLEGHPPVDVRYKNNQGNYVGGGPVPVTEGSIDNDTTLFRGRTTGGSAIAFNYGVRHVDADGVITSQDEPLVYASTGTQPADGDS